MQELCIKSFIFG